MDSPCLIVLMLAFVTIIAVQSSSAREASYLDVLTRRFNSVSDNDLKNNLILRAIGEQSAVNRKCRPIIDCVLVHIQNRMNS
jgi:hypothetical protein